jgi:hypothetical protein
MSVYTTPALNAVNFALTAHTAPSIASPQNALQSYVVPSLIAVNFALSGYSAPAYMDIGWELLSTFPTQYAGLRFFNGAVYELCLVATTDAPAGDQWRIDKNGTTYAVYLVDTTDPNASQVRVQTSEGLKAARFKT